MPYDTKAVANLLLELAEAASIRVSPMKLQKLLYYAHGWHLALNDAPLIDEPIEAWQYGPVVSSLYEEFRRFGNEPIRGFATTWDADDDRLVVPVLKDADQARVSPLLERILEVYGGFTAVKLSNMTHLDGSPWALTWRTPHAERHLRIDDALIKDHFRTQVEPNERGQPQLAS